MAFLGKPFSYLMKFRLAILPILSLFLVLSACTDQKEKSYVVLISIDGFRHDYAERYNAVNLLKIAQEGTSASSLIPCYPSKTFPNHYSIITGMYPENHGIVDNYFYDPKRNGYYMANQVETVKEGSWYGGTPLWSLANQQELKSATFFWIGSEAEINGHRPTYYKDYDPNLEEEETVNQITNWLKLPKEERPRFICAYFSLVDDAGHDYGVDSPELKEAVKKIDLNIGDLKTKLSELDLPINLVIVSDHGMTNTNYKEPIYFEDIINLSNIHHIYRDSHMMIYEPNDSLMNTMYDTLKSYENDRFITYKKEDIPSEYHYQINDRIGDLLLVANPPYIFSPKDEDNGKGTHGFDPIHEEMHGVFYAVGTDIKNNLKINSFKNIHIYPMIADILDLSYETLDIDGKHEVLKPILID